MFMLATEDNTAKRQKPEADRAPAEGAAKWFTRPGLAAVLGVSVSTVDRMAKSGDLPRVKLRGRVRFYLPDVIEALRKAGRKFGRAAELTAESAQSAETGAAVAKAEG
jgi:excisionase family DNA binding protein